MCLSYFPHHIFMEVQHTLRKQNFYIIILQYEKLQDVFCKQKILSKTKITFHNKDEKNTTPACHPLQCILNKINLFEAQPKAPNRVQNVICQTRFWNFFDAFEAIAIAVTNISKELSFVRYKKQFLFRSNIITTIVRKYFRMRRSISLLSFITIVSFDVDLIWSRCYKLTCNGGC